MINPDLAKDAAYKAWLDILNRDRKRFLTKEIDAVSEATRNLPGIKQTLDQYDRYQNWIQKGKAKRRVYNEQKGGFHAFLNKVEDGTNLAHQALGMPIEAVSKVTNIDPRAIGAAATVAAVGKSIKFPTTISKLPVKKTIKGKSKYASDKVVDTTAYSPVEPKASIPKYAEHAPIYPITDEALGIQMTSKGVVKAMAMTKNPKKLSKKDVAKNAKIETENALTLDATGRIKRSVPPELDFLSKLPEAEQVRRITTAITVQNQSEQRKPGDAKTSGLSLGTGEKVYNQPPEVKLAAGLQREAPWMLKKFGYAWDSVVEQAHHWFQKAFTGPFIQHMVKLARDPNSPITFYDVVNMEAAVQSRGIPGVGDSGVGGIIESIHNWSHKTDRKLGREPTGGTPLATSEMTPKQLKAEEAKQRKIFKHYKETGEDIEEFFPGPSLGILLENGLKLKTAKELTQYYIDIADEFYVPQMKRMQKLNEAARADLPEFAHNVEKSRFMRDDIKAIMRGDAPNTLGYTKEQLKAKKDEHSFEYKDSRDAQVQSAIKMVEGRDITEARKADLARENLIQGYEPGTPEYEYLEWIHLDESKRIRWRTGGGTQSFGRVK